MNRKIKYKGHLALLGANVIWGLFSPVSKAVLSSGYMSAFGLTLLRVTGAALVFWIASLFTRKEQVSPKDMALLFFASLFGIVFNQGFFVIGLSMTSPIDASLVTTMTPILTMIIASVYLKEPITSKKVMGIFMGAIGALLLILGSQHGSPTDNNSIRGDLFCLLAELSLAIYYTLFRGLIDRYTPVTLMKWMFIYAAICCVPFGYNDIVAIDFGSIPCLVYLETGYVILGATFLAYLLVPIGQKLLRPTVVSMYTYFQPIVASLVAVVVMNESFGLTKILAVILVFTGVYLVTRSKSRADLEKTE